MSDAVNHPSHYQGKIEVIDFIEDKELGFHLGNAVKYISRAGKKDPAKTVEDLEKAKWYIDRYISQEKQEKCYLCSEEMNYLVHCNNKVPNLIYSIKNKTLEIVLSGRPDVWKIPIDFCPKCGRKL